MKPLNKLNAIQVFIIRFIFFLTNYDVIIFHSQERSHSFVHGTAVIASLHGRMNFHGTNAHIQGKRNLSVHFVSEDLLEVTIWPNI